MSGNTVGLYGSTTTANVAGGNVTGLYRQTQAVTVDNGYNDADVQAFLETYTGNIQCGNIDVLTAATVNAIFTDGYYYANGTPIDIGANGYGNANVAAYLPTYTGNLAGGNLTLTASAFIGNAVTITNGLTTGGMITAGSDIQSAGNIRTTGASGNITGADYIQSNFFVGDGSLLTNVAGTGYGNANVSNYLASGTDTANIITTGNVSGSFILGNISQATGFPEVYGNANVATFLANFGSNVIVTTGNVTAGNIATGHLDTTGNVIISGTLFSDDITSTSVTVYGDQIITGNLTVQGTTTSLNSNVVTINDKTLTVANNASTQATVDGAGLEAGTPTVASWLYNALTNSWQSNIAITPTGNLTQTLGTNTNRWSTVYASDANIAANVTALGNISGSYILGNGSQLTGLPESYGNANVAAYLPTYTGNIGNVTNPAEYLWAGHLQTDSSHLFIESGFGNIYLTGDNIVNQGDSITTGNVTGTYFLGNGSQLTGIISSYGDSNVTTLLANLGVNAISSTANISTTANISGGYIIGNGSALNNITGANIVGAVANATYATSAGTADSATTATTVTGNAQANITSVGTLTNLSVTGNITTGNILTDGYYYANGTPISFGGSYGNSEVSAYLASGTNTANIITTGNVQGGNLLGIGSAITGINAFGNIAVSGQTTVSADTTTDTLTLVAGTNITLTTDAANNKITITSTASGGGETLSPFLLMGG